MQCVLLNVHLLQITKNLIIDHFFPVSINKWKTEELLPRRSGTTFYLVQTEGEGPFYVAVWQVPLFMQMSVARATKQTARRERANGGVCTTLRVYVTATSSQRWNQRRVMDDWVNKDVVEVTTMTGAKDNFHHEDKSSDKFWHAIMSWIRNLKVARDTKRSGDERQLPLLIFVVRWARAWWCRQILMGEQFCRLQTVNYVTLKDE